MTSHRELSDRREIDRLRAENLRMAEEIAKLKKRLRQVRVGYDAMVVVVGRTFEEVDRDGPG